MLTNRSSIRYNILDTIIKFKHIVTLYLIVLGKENIFCVSLVSIIVFEFKWKI